MNFFEFILEKIEQFSHYTGFANVTWGHIIMIMVGLFFIYIAIKKEYEIDKEKGKV